MVNTHTCTHTCTQQDIDKLTTHTRWVWVRQTLDGTRHDKGPDPSFPLSLLDVEIQMPRELQLSGQDFLVDAEGIVVKKRRVTTRKRKKKTQKRVKASIKKYIYALNFFQIFGPIGKAKLFQTISPCKLTHRNLRVLRCRIHSLVWA